MALAAGTGVSTYYASQAGARAREAESERTRTLQAFRKARQAVDDSFTLISENQLIDAPGFQPLRKELLQSSLEYYEGFLTDLADDLSVRAELAAAYRRVGKVRRTMGELSDAEGLYAKA
ncbi:MAG: hypothetical protein IH831_10840, partial [Planctomycetes bacterium]|nr:hypothetical protein [Planctomycetota bacterium]